jgi:hypothetical protein
MRFELLMFMIGITTFVFGLVVYVKDRRSHGANYDAFRLRFIDNRVHIDVPYVRFQHTNIPALEVITGRIASPIPPVWSLDRIAGKETTILSLTGDSVSAISTTSACWAVPDGYQEFAPNPFVYRVKSTEVRYDGRVLFYDNATHVLGVGLDVCMEVTGFAHAVPYWDPVLGDFLRCRTRITAPELFLGVYCKIAHNLVLDLCPLGSQMRTSVCAVSEVIQKTDLQ